MSEEEPTQPIQRKPFRRYYYRGYEVPNLLDLPHAQLVQLLHARARRRILRRLKPSYFQFLKRLRKAKKLAEGEKPAVVKTHLRDMIILPEMVNCAVGVYNGMNYTHVDIKPDMIGHYLGEFSITYRPVCHNRPGVGATKSSRFIPLK